MIRSSSKARIDVASPSSVCRRHTNPGAASAIAFTGSSISTKPRSCSESIGASRTAMLTCARCQPPMLTVRAS
jgi:hypothetical protein